MPELKFLPKDVYNSLINYIKNNYYTEKIQSIADKYGVSRCQIQRIARNKLRLPSKKPNYIILDEAIKNRYEVDGANIIAQEFGVTKSIIYHRAFKLNKKNLIGFLA